MAYKHDTTRRRESESCPGVSFLLRKMTEGRRLEYRAKLREPNAKLRDILREQGKLLEVPADARDHDKIMDLQDQYEGLQIEILNPETLKWGVKQIEGLEVDGKTLTLEDWKEWPSHLFAEILEAVNQESQLNGGEIKNSPSPTTSGEPVGSSDKNTIVGIVEKSGSSAVETADAISQSA